MSAGGVLVTKVLLQYGVPAGMLVWFSKEFWNHHKEQMQKQQKEREEYVRLLENLNNTLERNTKALQSLDEKLDTDVTDDLED